MDIKGIIKMSDFEVRRIEALCIRHQLNKDAICQECPSIDVVKLDACLEAFAKGQKRVNDLMKIPKVEQKSEKWYELRQNLITASDFAQALGHGKFGTKDDIIKKKVAPQEEPTFAANNPFFKWGNMFEPLACQLYSSITENVIVHEFGLLPHETRPYFGASPDGITEYGVMLEIKCPFKRKIETGGEVPKQYYYQIQGQLEVCGLEKCDYFECQFKLYKNKADFFSNIDDDNIKGIIIETQPSQYIYSSFSEIAKWDFETWLNDQLNEVEDIVDVKFWYLSHYNIQRVELDKTFVEEKLDELEVTWNKILEYRNNKEKYEVEVKKVINIGETARLRPRQQQQQLFDTPQKKQGYAFIDDGE